MTYSRHFFANHGAPGVSAEVLNEMEQGIVDAQAGQAPVPIKQAKVATTANITLSGLQTIDGVALSTGDRVLVKNQSTGSQNGIYDVASGSWVRSFDASSSALMISGTLVVIDQGTASADTIWMLSTSGPITLGTTSLTFVRPSFPSTDASTTAKGAVYLTATPVTPTNPYVLGQNDPAFETYETGCSMVWNSGTSISVTSGAMYVPGSNKIVNVSGALTPSLPTLAANTWYYVYLYESGTAAAEVVTTAPNSPYKGSARAKTGDTSRRFVGALRSNAAGTAVFAFQHLRDRIEYLENTFASPFAVLSDGAATTETNVSCSAVVPPTTQTAMLEVNNSSSTGGYPMFGHSQDNVTLGSANGVAVWRGSGTSSTGFAALSTNHSAPLDSSQQFSYRYNSSPAASPNRLYVYCLGYVNTR